MNVNDFLAKVPLSFVVECLDALPGVDRKRLLQAHNCRVKLSAGSLSKKARSESEAKKLYAALMRSEDSEDKRSIFQGWLARRAALIVGLLEAWEVTHQGGFVENFDWVAGLDKEKVTAAMAKVKEANPEVATDLAFMIYFAYLELPILSEIFDVDQVFAAQQVA
jgi:hypothetical protein